MGIKVATKSKKSVTKKSRVSSVSKKSGFKFRAWMGVLVVLVIAAVGVAVVRFSEAGVSTRDLAGTVVNSGVAKQAEPCWLSGDTDVQRIKVRLDNGSEYILQKGTYRGADGSTDGREPATTWWHITVNGCPSTEDAFSPIIRTYLSGYSVFPESSRGHKNQLQHSWNTQDNTRPKNGDRVFIHRISD